MPNKPHYIHEVFIKKSGEDLGSTYRDATEKEIKQAQSTHNEFHTLMAEQKRIEDRIQELIKECKHVVVSDEVGFMYDTRTCLACGHNDYI